MGLLPAKGNQISLNTLHAVAMKDQRLIGDLFRPTIKETGQTFCILNHTQYYMPEKREIKGKYMRAFGSDKSTVSNAFNPGPNGFF